jgi:Holliday junction resolvase RusA-like endonuclease
MKIDEQWLLANGIDATTLATAKGCATTHAAAKSDTPKARTSSGFALSPIGLVGPWRVEISGWHPPSLNALLTMHWAKRAKLKKKAHRLIRDACLSVPVVHATGRRRVTQILTLAGNDRIRDDDNAWKAVLDSLVKCGALVDDRPEFVETMPVQYERGTERKTTLIIEDTP